MLTFIGGPAEGKASGLCLRRAPLYLRLVHDGKEWDALDQLSDKPGFDESIYVYRKTEDRGMIHICRRPGGCGTFVRARYEFVEPQPPEDVLRYNSRWREWATAEAAKSTRRPALTERGSDDS